MTISPVLANGGRVPIPYYDERGIPCYKVPLDDEGLMFARIEQTDYDHIEQTISCPAAWYLNPNGSGLLYVTVNIPQVAGHESGTMPVTRMFMGSGAGQCVRYVTDDRCDLRRCNLEIGTGQGAGRSRHNGETHMKEAVQRQQAAKIEKDGAGRQGQEGIKNVR